MFGPALGGFWDGMTGASLIPLLGVVCAVLCAPAVFADSLMTVTCTIQPTSMVYNGTSCSFTGFQASLGTLENVTLQITALDGTGYAEQYNYGGSAVSFIGSAATIGLTATGPDGAQSTATAISGSCAGSVPAQGNTSCTPSSLSGANGVVADAYTLSDYEAVSGPFLIRVSAAYSASGTVVGSGSLVFAGAGSVGLTLNVTYYYTAFSSELATPILCGGLLSILAARLGKRRARGRSIL